MSLVIKSLGTQAPEGAERLYRDALVTKGSLLAVDFSNRGTLDNFDVASPVLDLAREPAAELGVVNMIENTYDSDSELSQGRGVQTYEGEEDPGATKGMVFSGGLLPYLYENQPNSIAILWARVNEDYRTEEEVAIMSFDTNLSSGVNGTDFRSRLTETNRLTLSFGGSGIAGGDISPSYSLQQVAVEFRPGETNRYFIDGVFRGETNDVTAFSNNTAFAFGPKIKAKAPAADAAIYRFLIEDLEQSGRTADEVVLKDYNYVHALGEFEGIPKRPFVDAY